MKNFKPRVPRALRAIRLSAMGVTLCAGTARGDTFDWIGQGPSSVWPDPANWVDETSPAQNSTGYPQAGDTAILGGDGVSPVYLQSANLAVDTLSIVQVLVLPPSPGLLIFLPGLSSPYTISSLPGGGGGSTLTLNNINQSETSPFLFTNLGTNVFDDTVQVNGPTDAPLYTNANIDFQGPLDAPGGLDMQGNGSLGLSSAQNIILRNAANSIGGPINVYGTLTGIEPASLSGAPIVLAASNYGAPLGDDGLQLFSDQSVANYGNDVTVNTTSTIQIGPESAFNNGELPTTPLGDPTADQFDMGNLDLAAESFFGSQGVAYLSITATRTHDTISFHSLSMTGSATITLDESSYTNSRSIAEVGGMSSQPGEFSIFDSPPPPNVFTLNGGELDVTAASPNFGANIQVQAGLLVAAADGALGTGSTHVPVSGALEFSQTQTDFPTVVVDQFGAIGGDLTGAVYGQNVTLADGAILFPTVGPLPTRGADGAVYWKGITSLTETDTIGDDGVTSIYRGLAFGPFTPDGGFVGTINEEFAGQGVQIAATSYTAIGNPSGGQATFNSTGDVTIVSTEDGFQYFNNYHPVLQNEVDFLTAPAGTARVFDLTAPDDSPYSDTIFPNFNMRASNVIPAGYTINVESGQFVTDEPDSVADGAKVNIGAGATLIQDGVGGTTTGAFEIESGGRLFVSNDDGAPSHGASYIFDPGSVIEFAGAGTVDMGSPTWLSPNSDVLVDEGSSSLVDAGLVLGAGRRISTSDTFYGGNLDGGTGISADPNAPSNATFIFSAATGATLEISDPITFGPNQTLQIGDPNPWSYNGLVQNGIVNLNSSQATVGFLNIAAGTLQLGQSGNPVLPFNVVQTLTIGSNATLAGNGGINAGKIVIAGTIAPGFSPGTMTLTGNTTIMGGASYQWQINSTQGTAGNDPGWDLFSVQGSITLDGGAATNPIVVTVQSLDTSDSADLLADFDPTRSYSFAFMEATSILNFQPADFSLDLSQFQNTYDGTWSIQQNGVGELDIDYTAIPEPVGIAWAAAGASLLLRRRGKRIANDAPEA